MTSSITWVHVGDVHADAADGWQGIDRLEQVVARLVDVPEGIDFLFLPGDNANHATPEQYTEIRAALAGARVPVLTIPGDHDFEDGTLAAYRAGTPPDWRPFSRVIAGHRCLFLDVVSAGAGGPDFRLGAGQRDRLARALAESDDDAALTPLVFMHAFPSDHADGGEALATLFADAGVAFVDTGHTHYNELLNDGRTVYGATRSSAQIEEEGGAPGYSVVSVHGGVPSWTFRPLDAGWPHVQILSPADVRLITRPYHPCHVPAPGEVEVVARVLGQGAPAPTVAFGGEAWPMQRDAAHAANWCATITVPRAGLHRLTVASGDSRDTIELLVRERKDAPKRGRPVAPGNAIHSIGAWESRHLFGTRLGPNANGRPW
ncbi:metallophosphoesterase [Sphingomonas sp. RHCKR7]|uniref:metallophosphoesterase family protein n=1 Tax=Sphingomonas folli TaxID=2862497 RepID=UPI001CA56779|nr:metallophosphoesterase [Sphingomonas folli]MBW6529013.1 metallophosphoesterase [Sphingomonas folli]